LSPVFFFDPTMAIFKRETHMNKLLRKGNKGFTLIELMIVVAIIGILAAIAIPNFLRFQLKSKTSEAKVNLAAIRTAEESYLAEFGNYVNAAAGWWCHGLRHAGLGPGGSGVLPVRRGRGWHQRSGVHRRRPG
jgi:prepilin-type N-terminal cleavage/methylation domain-containing protein